MMVKAVKLEGTSMLPLFKAGDVVLIAPLSPDTSSCILKRGDCAVYEHEGRILLHRVVRTDEAGVWFADDSGRIKPHLVLWPAVRGKVLSHNPFAAGLPGFLYSRVRTLAWKLCRNFQKNEL